MSDQEKKQQSTSISPEPDAEKKQGTELSEEELNKVSGGYLQIGMKDVQVSSTQTSGNQ
jgi:bacteriocin-like protein